jgi:hypothetical protein
LNFEIEIFFVFSYKAKNLAKLRIEKSYEGIIIQK